MFFNLLRVKNTWFYESNWWDQVQKNCQNNLWNIISVQYTQKTSKYSLKLQKHINGGHLKVFE